jgi:hypothetical protein
MRAPCRLIVTIAAEVLAVASGSTLADAHDGGGNGGDAGEHHGQPHGNDDRGQPTGNAVLRSTLFGSKTAAHGGPTLFAVAPGGVDWVPPSPCPAPAVLINPAPAGTAVTTTYIAASGT